MLVRESIFLKEAKQNNITFVRFGSLNIQKYDKQIADEFHKPPKKYGIFAFIWPYIEPFLYMWKIPDRKEETTEDYRKRSKEWIRTNFHKFEYSGYLWTHFTDLNIPGERIGSWIKIHTDDLNDLLKKVKHEDIKQLQQNSKNPIIDPYKRGLGGFMSKDHLEVFIENKI